MGEEFMKRIKQGLVLLLSIILVINSINISTSAYAEETENYVICSFATLEESIKHQEVPIGTEQSALNLPTTLSVGIESGQ